MNKNKDNTIKFKFNRFEKNKKSSKLSKEGEVYNVQRSTASFNLEITTTPERNDSTPDIIEQ